MMKPRMHIRSQGHYARMQVSLKILLYDIAHPPVHIVTCSFLQITPFRPCPADIKTPLWRKVKINIHLSAYFFFLPFLWLRIFCVTYLYWHITHILFGLIFEPSQISRQSQTKPNQTKPSQSRLIQVEIMKIQTQICFQLNSTKRLRMVVTFAVSNLTQVNSSKVAAGCTCQFSLDPSSLPSRTAAHIIPLDLQCPRHTSVPPHKSIQHQYTGLIQPWLLPNMDQARGQIRRISFIISDLRFGGWAPLQAPVPNANLASARWITPPSSHARLSIIKTHKVIRIPIPDDIPLQLHSFWIQIIFGASNRAPIHRLVHRNERLLICSKPIPTVLIPFSMF